MATTAVVAACLHRAVASPPFSSYLAPTTALCGGDACCPDFPAEGTGTQSAGAANPRPHREPAAELARLRGSALGRLILRPHSNGGRRAACRAPPSCGRQYFNIAILACPSFVAVPVLLSPVSLPESSGKRGCAEDGTCLRSHGSSGARLRGRQCRPSPAAPGVLVLPVGCLVLPLLLGPSAGALVCWCAHVPRGETLDPEPFMPRVPHVGVSGCSAVQGPSSRARRPRACEWSRESQESRGVDPGPAARRLHDRRRVPSFRDPLSPGPDHGGSPTSFARWWRLLTDTREALGSASARGSVGVQKLRVSLRVPPLHPQFCSAPTWRLRSGVLIHLKQ